MWKWEVPIKVWDRSQRKKMGFWDWSQSPQYAVVGLIPQNTGTCPRTAFYFNWDQSQDLKFFPLGYEPVCKRIFFLDRIEYRILFVQAKSTESNIEYYLFCKKYSNNIRMVQNIRIFEYFWIILKDKIKK